MPTVWARRRDPFGSLALALCPMNPLDLVGLGPLMERTEGNRGITVGVIDGPFRREHPAFSGASIREIPGSLPAACADLSSAACLHGTLVMGILAARRGSGAPGICPNCSFLVRPIFSESSSSNGDGPAASPGELATAVLDAVHAGARIINLSASLVAHSSEGEGPMTGAFHYAARRGVLIVAAAGNQGGVGGSPITNHPWVIPVTACDQHGRPLQGSNLGASIGRYGLAAPAEGIKSVKSGGGLESFNGTSAAAPFVSGTIALLWSEFPRATAADLKTAVTHPAGNRRTSIVPPLLDAWAAYQVLSRN